MRLTTVMSMILLVALAACMAGQVAPPYDGKWWKSLSAAEQNAFVSGYLDCYVWEAKGSDYSGQSIQQEIRSLSDFYWMNPGKMGTSVPEVLQKLDRPNHHEQTGEWHGVYDGDFWRQLSPPGRVAFIRGYIACVRLHLSNRFSRPLETYVKTISAWYGVSDTDESELNDGTANDKIGDVLARLRDKTPQPK